MRILLILTVVILVLAAGASRMCSGSLLPSPTVPATKATTGPSAAPAAVTPSTGNSGPRAQRPSGSEAAVTVPVEASGSYRFEYRDVPSVEWFGSWSSAGVFAVNDPLTRTVTFWGNALGVPAMADALRTLDQVQGSCALFAWCVYVDETQEKGWDLVAAIRDIAGSNLRAVAGAGGVTLTVNAGDLGAILSVIADGSTVEVLQRPYMRLTHDKPAIVEAISEIPLPETTLSNGLSQTSIKYRKVGLQMTVTPRFLPGERVTLNVEQNNGIVGPYVEIAGSSVPQIDSQRVSTTVELAIGDAAVLGGVRTARVRRARGIMRDKLEVSNGYMYVVVSTLSEIPRAESPDAPWAGSPNPAFLDGMVLPPLDMDVGPWNEGQK